MGGTVKGKTVKEECYAYVANGSYKMATGSGAKQNIESMQLWKGLDNAIVSPQTVVYITKQGNNYDLEAQGRTMSQIAGGYDIKVELVSGTTDIYTLSTTVSGIAASLWVEKTKRGRYNMDGNIDNPSHYQATTTSQGGDAYRQWKIVPISASSNNYVAVNACLKVKDEEDETKFKYYAPYFASYPFKLVSPGMKAYYVSSITDKKYVLQEITNEVIPAATPVIIECPSDNPMDCKIEPLHGDYGSINGNKLKGVYFCNLSMAPSTYPECRTEFKSASMRVWAAKDDKLILTKDSTRAVHLATPGYSGIWLRSNESYLADVPSTASAELVPAGKATTINFDTDGGTTVEDISGGEGEPVTAPTAPTKTGYKFTGWNPALPSVFPAEDMTVKAQWEKNKYTITFNTNPAENLTINALWTTNKYTITFDTDGGTAVAPISGDYGMEVKAPENPTKTGYTFIGWDKEIPSSIPAGNVVIKAQWKINTYTITFNTDGGSEVAPITQDYNTAITKPSDPTKAGSSFAGWDKEIPDYMPAENITIKALWTVGKYTITFDTDGGTTVAPISGDYGMEITPPENPTKTGYTFVGWDKEIPTTMPASDIVIKAQWKINQYTISYFVDEQPYKSEKKDYGSEIIPEAAPSKTGYTFSGWVESIPERMPALDLTINGSFSINRYTITFDTDGGTAISPITQDYNTVISKPADPTKDGSVFAGWDKEIPSNMPAENMTIKALWNKLYTITFDTDGGSEITSITAVSGTEITKPSDPTKKGHSFAGWKPSIPATMPEQDLVCKAEWNVNKYKVTFKLPNGTIISEKELDYGSVIEVPIITEPSFKGWTPVPDSTVPDHDVVYEATFDKNTITFDTDGGGPVPEAIFETYDTDITDRTKNIKDPTKEGYTFIKWDPAIPSKMPAENLTIKALWQINQYTITFDTDGGTPVNPITQDYQSTIATPTILPIKVGYTFMGWNPALPEKMPLNGFSTKALWQINQYTLTFDTDGGTAIDPITQNYNTAITKPSDPTRTGYDFNGWSQEIPSTMPAENMTIKAQWQIKQYTITFDTDGGTVIDPITQDYNTEINKPSDPTKTGYEFVGWDNIPSTMPANNVTVKALWQIKQYTITFDIDGGSAVDPITQDYNTAINKPSDPTKTGYEFVGWDKEIPSVMPAEDMTIKALWQINQYTITFNTDGGTAIDPITQDYNIAITKPSDPTKTGYTFIGWDKEIPSTMPAENMTVKALWQINQYTITFDTDGGTVIEPMTKDYNAAIAKPDDPTREGYTFVGWDKVIPDNMPAENITIKAQWQINKHSITYSVDGNLYKKIENIEYGTPIIPEEKPAKKGYTFSGWSTIPPTMPDNDVSVVGEFIINQYTIIFDTDGGSEIAPITQDYDTKIQVETPTKDGYDFVGWDPALPEIMPEIEDGTLTLKAIWGPKRTKYVYTLNEGWTWVSFFMINDQMSSFDTVLSSLKWTSTDEIKGADTWAIYSAKKKKWVGTMEGFNDLSMYKIHSSYPDQELELEGSYVNSKANQKVSVEKGWNYLPYLSLSALPVEEALQNYNASEGDVLKSQSHSATYTKEGWKVSGGLTSMEPGKGYMLYRSADSQVSFTYPIALEEEKSNGARAMRFESKAQRFSSNMNVFATVEGVMAVPGDSIVAYAVDGVRGGATIDDEGKASLTVLGDNNADIYLALMHNNTIVASAKAPISYASDNIVGSYANPTAIEFVEGSEAWSGDYNVTAIFTMDGKKLPSTDIKTLTTGLYIIKYETLSDNNSNIGGCRVIRIVR